MQRQAGPGLRFAGYVFDRIEVGSKASAAGPAGIEYESVDRERGVALFVADCVAEKGDDVWVSEEWVTVVNADRQKECAAGDDCASVVWHAAIVEKVRRSGLA